MSDNQNRRMKLVGGDALDALNELVEKLHKATYDLLTLTDLGEMIIANNQETRGDMLRLIAPLTGDMAGQAFQCACELQVLLRDRTEAA